VEYIWQNPRRLAHTAVIKIDSLIEIIHVIVGSPSSTALSLVIHTRKFKRGLEARLADRYSYSRSYFYGKLLVPSGKCNIFSTKTSYRPCSRLDYFSWVVKVNINIT
jgi:hypothetical protein